MVTATHAKTTPEPDLDTVDLSTALHALADPVRLEIVRQLGECPKGSALSCGEIELPVTKSTGSHHLRILHEAGITSEREEGRRKYIRLRREELERRFPGLLASVLRAADPAPSS
jgi:DNA-binding transcriptional ArsR family regulator